LIKDYDLEIHYHPRKANVVADALSRKSYCNSLVAKERLPELHEEFEKLRIEACDSGYLRSKDQRSLEIMQGDLENQEPYARGKAQKLQNR